jgi:alkylhydroperoxidase family enzyme
MPSRIDPLAPDDADDEAVAALLRETAAWYDDTAFFGAMAHRPPLLERFVALFEAFAESGRLDAELLELVRLRVAAVHECAYCGTVRTREVADAVAPREAAVLGDEVDADPLTDREALAVRLADQLSRDPQRLTDECFAGLRAEFGDETLVELLLFATLEIGLDRFCIALRLDTTDGSPYPSNLTYPLSRDGD